MLLLSYLLFVVCFLQKKLYWHTFVIFPVFFLSGTDSLIEYICPFPHGFVNRSCESSEAAQQVKELVTESDVLSSVPGTYTGKEKHGVQKLSSVLHKCPH